MKNNYKYSNNCKTCMYSLFDDEISTNIEHYQIQGWIYESNNTQVRHVVDRRNNEELAVKIYTLDNYNTENVSNSEMERDILTILDHPNVVKLIYSHSEPRAIYLFMPYFPLTLEQFIEKLPHSLSPKRAIDFFSQLTDAICYLHIKQNIAHNDIKASNCLISENNLDIVLCDFQFASVIPVQNPSTSVKRGTPLYASPELMTKETHNPFENDIWSFGILFYVMLHKHYPFDSKEDNVRQLAQCIKNDHHNFTYTSYNPDLDLLFEKLLDGMLAKNPQHRLTIQEVKRLILKL